MVQIFENFGVLLQIIVLLLILFMQIENYGHNLLGAYVFSNGKKVIIILCHFDDFRTFQFVTMSLRHYNPLEIHSDILNFCLSCHSIQDEYSIDSFKTNHRDHLMIQ